MFTVHVFQWHLPPSSARTVDSKNTCFHASCVLLETQCKITSNTHGKSVFICPEINMSLSHKSSRMNHIMLCALITLLKVSNILPILLAGIFRGIDALLRLLLNTVAFRVEVLHLYFFLRLNMFVSLCWGGQATDSESIYCYSFLP